MKGLRLNRRHFLKGSGAMVALPVLECMLDTHGKAFASTGAALPRRFGVYFFGNGVPLETWHPQSVGATWSLPECLSPLAPVKEYCNVLSGYNVLTGSEQAHHGGQAGILSGLPYLEISSNSDAFASKYSGPSIDQLIAQSVGTPTALSSLELGVSKAIVTDRGSTLSSIAHESANVPLPPLRNPAEVYELLFADYVPATQPQNRLRNHILDAVRDDIHALKQKLGTQDRLRLDEHLTHLSELRQRILDLPAAYINSCLPLDPVNTTNTDTNALEPLEEINRLMCDLWVMAWSCDLTRVTSMMYTGGMGETIFHPVPGVTQGHYAIINEGDVSAQELLPQITTFTVSQCNYLLEKMAATQEGDGNLLDNSLILMTSGRADLSSAPNVDYPVVLAGGCGGSLRTPGIHHREPGGNVNDILVTVLLAMQTGLGVIGVGASQSTSPISEILI